jgi:heme/copper-type cytochrome/quinol oxidase subunit 2
MKIFKTILTLVFIVLQYFVWNYPIANTASVNQLQDTPTSTTASTMMSHLITFSPIITLFLVVIVWWSELSRLIDKFVIEQGGKTK